MGHRKLGDIKGRRDEKGRVVRLCLSRLPCWSAHVPPGDRTFCVVWAQLTCLSVRTCGEGCLIGKKYSSVGFCNKVPRDTCGGECLGHQFSFRNYGSHLLRKQCSKRNPQKGNDTVSRVVQAEELSTWQSNSEYLGGLPFPGAAIFVNCFDQHVRRRWLFPCFMGDSVSKK